MADVFVSYAREDRERIASLVELLESRAWSVFWDRDIPPGESWRSFIGAELERARCVVVAWSEHSIASDWVIEEADEARGRDVLVPVLLDEVLPPRGLRGVQAADLTRWPGAADPEILSSFLAAVATLVGGRAAAKVDAGLEPSEPKATVSQRRLLLAGGSLAVAGLAGLVFWLRRDAGPVPESRRRDPTTIPIEEGSSGKIDPRQTKILPLKGRVLTIEGKVVALEQSR